MSELAQALVIYGPLGIACIGLAYAVGKLQMQLLETQQRCEAAQQARVDDAKKVADTLLSISDENNQVISELTRAVEHNNRGLDALADANRSDVREANGRARDPRQDPRVDIVDPRRPR